MENKKTLGLRPESFDFLEKYLTNFSPVGYESNGQKIWMDYLKPYVHTFMSDVYGTVVGVINPDAPYKVAIEAHADEISWRVSYVSEKGYLYVKKNGGSDCTIAPSKRVKIFCEDGQIVEGFFGWPAVHVRREGDDKPPKIENLTIDIGASSKKEAEDMGVHVGAVVVFDEGMKTLNDKFLSGRALDNRIGGFMIAEVARLLHENGNKLPFGLYIINSVQEEVGLRGAEMISRKIKPNVAIVTDVTHDTQSPLYSKVKDGDLSCGLGPVLKYAPAVQNNLRKLIIDTAKSNEIPFQRSVGERATGTDTDSFAYSGEGVASALISLPLKYMHTTVETVHKDDIHAVIKLMYKTILSIKDGQDFGYLK
jgi:putative aminopeptidase FrvX